MSVAIEINPELMIMDKTSGAGAAYRLDSGTEDLNRVIASEKLDTLNFIDIPIEGFDTYLYFDDLAAVANFVKQVKLNNDAVDLTPYTKVKTEDTAIVVVHGRVSIVLSDSSAKTVELCRPVYQVHPNKKTRQLFPVQDVRNYVTSAWAEECKEALFHSGEDAVQRFGVVKRLKESEKLQLNLLKLVLAFATVVIVIIALGALFKDGGAISAANASTAQSPAAELVSQQGNSLMNANNPMSEQQLAQIQANNAHPASAVYGNGMNGAEGQATVEDFARLQVEQTQNMLKEMGVDVTANKQNLGCFAEDRS